MSLTRCVAIGASKNMAMEIEQEHPLLEDVEPERERFTITDARRFLTGCSDVLKKSTLFGVSTWIGVCRIQAVSSKASATAVDGACEGCRRLVSHSAGTMVRRR